MAGWRWRQTRRAGLRPAGSPPSPPPYSLFRIDAFLDSVDMGDYIVTGELEAYSCEGGARGEGRGARGATALARPPTPQPPPPRSPGKLAGLDKKLSRSLDAEVALSSNRRSCARRDASDAAVCLRP